MQVEPLRQMSVWDTRKEGTNSRRIVENVYVKRDTFTQSRTENGKKNGVLAAWNMCPNRKKNTEKKTVGNWSVHIKLKKYVKK